MPVNNVATRHKIIYLILIIFGLIFTSRLFFIQVVNGEKYKELAAAGQLKKFVIPASRGSIYMRDGENKIPLVLNQNYKIIYADPRYVDNPGDTAEELSKVLGGKASDFEGLLSQEDKVYVVLKKSVPPNVAEKLEELELSGIGAQDAPKRIYPEKTLASQVLGFVNDEGQGQYGIEGYLNEDLSGTEGLLKAVTDARGIPLSTSDEGSVEQPAKNGDDIVLTIDRSVQNAVEEAIKDTVERTGGESGSAIVIDPSSGAILAMANYPTYNPAKFFEVKDARLFGNNVISDAYEPGSVIKPFTMSGGLQSGAVKPSTTYYDSGSVEIDGWKIENAGEKIWGQQTMTNVIAQSINTGVIFVLEQMGGGSINVSGRKKLYNFFTNNFRFGTTLGISLPGESAGQIIGPEEAEGNNVKYANMTFGQGMTATILQVASSFVALVNGGDYYQPYLVHSTIDGSSGEEKVTEPQVISNNAVTDDVSQKIRKMLLSVVNDGGGYYTKRPGYTIGGKTGTSQLLDPDGTYSDTRQTGSFVGFISSKKVTETPDFVIMTRVVEPKVKYGGSEAASPLFGDIADFLIKYYQITPSS